MKAIPCYSKMTQFCFILFILITIPASIYAGTISEATEACLDCHISITPGIVGDWQKSLHSKIIEAEKEAEELGFEDFFQVY